jgi:hypothetical protein
VFQEDVSCCVRCGGDPSASLRVYFARSADAIRRGGDRRIHQSNEMFIT